MTENLEKAYAGIFVVTVPVRDDDNLLWIQRIDVPVKLITIPQRDIEGFLLAGVKITPGALFVLRAVHGEFISLSVWV